MSSITVDLPVEIVQQLELQAKQQGLDPQQLASDLIVGILGKQSTEKEVSEVDLLQRVNLGFGDKWWSRYHLLIELRQAETLTEDEHLQLIEMSNALELANVDRVKALIAIAQLRGCDIKDVMKSSSKIITTPTPYKPFYDKIELPISMNQKQAQELFP